MFKFLFFHTKKFYGILKFIRNMLFVMIFEFNSIKNHRVMSSIFSMQVHKESLSAVSSSEGISLVIARYSKGW